jgi:hypothetical protein
VPYSHYITNSRFVLLTGAGASVPFGFKTLDQLLDLVTNEIKSAKEKDLLNRIVVSLKSNLKDQDRDSVNLEHVLEVIEQFRFADRVVSEFINSNSDTKAKIKVGLRLRESIFKALLSHFDRISEIDETAILELYQPLFARISLYLPKNSKLIPVFTTNYDRTIEYLHDDRRFLVKDGFRRDIRDGLVWNPLEFNELTDSLESLIQLPLFKLHGSVGWYRDLKSNQIELITRKLAPTELEQRLVNAVLYPAQTKSVTEEPYLTCYDYFEECLRNARLLVVIGHSFGDSYLNHIIKKSFTANSDLRLLIFNPGFAKSSIRSRFSALRLPDDQITKSYHYFSPKEDGEKLLEMLEQELKKVVKSLQTQGTTILRLQESLEGVLVRGSGRAFYKIEDNKKRAFPDLETFYALGNRSEDVRRLPDEQIQVIPNGEDYESVYRGRLIRQEGTASVWIILNIERHHVRSWDILHEWGRDDTEVDVVEKKDMEKYPKGNPI